MIKIIEQHTKHHREKYVSSEARNYQILKEISYIMDIDLRLIQQESIKDRQNYFALQKSVAIFPNVGFDDKKEYEDKSWQDQFENKNRICYVIETISECFYCGECAVKDISVKIPEIEIELMPEYRFRGIGCKAIIMMLNILSEQYGKQEFYAKVEPDNYASQFLIERLKGKPVGLAKDFQISDERVKQFVESHRYLLDGRIKNIAKVFEVEEDLLLTNLLVYKLNVNDLPQNGMDIIDSDNKREYIECFRKLSKEKYRDMVSEWIEDLEEIENLGEAKDKISAKISAMESKLLNKMELMKTSDFDKSGIS